MILSPSFLLLICIAKSSLQHFKHLVNGAEWPCGMLFELYAKLNKCIISYAALHISYFQELGWHIVFVSLQFISNLQVPILVWDRIIGVSMELKGVKSLFDFVALANKLTQRFDSRKCGSNGSSHIGRSRWSSKNNSKSKKLVFYVCECLFHTKPSIVCFFHFFFQYFHFYY